MIKTFENYMTKGVDIWIVGVPSGEAFQVNSNNIEELYRQKLLYYDTKYKEIGFYAFKDENRNDFIKAAGIKDPSENFLPPVGNPGSVKKDYQIYDDHLFDKELVKHVKRIVEDCPFFVELYIYDRFMSFTFGEDNDEQHFEIEKNYSSPKYTLRRNYKSKLIDSYAIASDKLLLKRVDHELYMG